MVLLPAGVQFTVTLKLHAGAEEPATMQTTVVVPAGKKLPEGGWHSTSAGVPQAV
jgi:hypothetical protein